MNRGKALWLIDAGYLFRGNPLNEYGYQVNYKKLRDWLEQDGPIWRAYYLNAAPAPPTEEQDRFNNWLRTGPPDGPKLITKIYDLKRFRVDRAYCEDCGTMVTPECSTHKGHKMYREQQKGVDVGLATLALTLAHLYDTLVLSSGDGDLLDAVEYLSMQGKQLELVVYKMGVSSELQARADHIHWIDDFKDDVRT